MEAEAMMYWGDAGGWVWLWMLIPAVFWVVFLGFVAWGISQVVAGGRREQTESALDILQRRYAQGEIDHDEFEHRRQTLRRLG